MNVETELRDQWLLASQRWRDDLLLLQHRELQRYLHGSQPPRVARWLQLREDSETRPGGVVPKGSQSGAFGCFSRRSGL